jgi:hypothetical protein
MTEIDNLDWNLAQVAAWIVYREAELVVIMATAGARDFGTIGLYPSMWPEHRQIHSTLDDLKIALRNGLIEASGYQYDSPNKLEAVPKKVWADLHLRPPYAYSTENLTAMFQPWRNIRVESSAVKKHWPLTKKNTKHLQLHDWELVKGFWGSLTKEQFYQGSQRQLIEMIQNQYQKQTSLTPPSRSQIQKYIKEWKLAGPRSEN